jgi:uncharacterized damage-inducible protein DinB
VANAFTKEGLRALHQWTHECLDLLFSHAATVPFSLLTRQVLEPGVPSIRDLLVHILFTEAAWVCDLQDIPIAKWRPESYTTVEALVAAKREVVAATAAFLDGLSENQLNAELSVRSKEWAGALRSPAFILHHVLTHAFHHKGQIATMFRVLGHPLPDTDLQR